MTIIADHLKNGKQTKLIYENIIVVETCVNPKHRYSIRNENGETMMGFYLYCKPNGLSIRIPTENESEALLVSKRINEFINDNNVKEFTCELDDFDRIHKLELSILK